jgi:hypothetical protein
LTQARLLMPTAVGCCILGILQDLASATRNGL